MTRGALVVNADDLGVSRGATLGIVRAHREGIVTSASLAATTPFYEHALAEGVRACPELGIGLHFTLTSGRPVSPVRRVPLLVDGKGYFRWRFLSLLAAVSLGAPRGLLDQIELELDAQLERLARDGIRPDHIDGERHVHLIPGIFERVAAAAARRGVPFVRLGRDAGGGFVRAGDLPRLALGGGWAKSCLLAGLAARGRSVLGGRALSAERVASYLYSGRLDLLLPRLLDGPPPAGTVEIMVHPGIPEESRDLELGNRGVERYLASEDRRKELDACIAARGRTGGWRLATFAQLARERPKPA